MAQAEDIHVHIHIRSDPAVMAALTRLENNMATEAEVIAALNAKFDSFASDVRAFIATAQTVRDELGPEGQAQLDALSAKLDALDVEVGDADGDGV